VLEFEFIFEDEETDDQGLGKTIHCAIFNTQPFQLWGKTVSN